MTFDDVLQRIEQPAYLGKIVFCCGKKWFVLVGGTCPRCGKTLWPRIEREELTDV